MNMDGRKQSWYEQRGGDENQRTGPEANLLPNLFQVMPVFRHEPAAPHGAHCQSGTNHSNDTGNSKHLFAQKIHDIREGEGEGNLGGLRVAKKWHKCAERASAEEPKHEPA